MRNFRKKVIPYKALGIRVYSSHVNPYMINKNKPLWENFDSLIEQAVVHQKASRYSDLNEEMRWALAIATLRENKTEILDAEYDHFNQLVADILVTRGSFKSLRRLYDELVATIIESKPSQDAHVVYCIDRALEKKKTNKLLMLPKKQRLREAIDYGKRTSRQNNILDGQHYYSGNCFRASIRQLVTPMDKFERIIHCANRLYSPEFIFIACVYASKSYSIEKI